MPGEAVTVFEKEAANASAFSFQSGQQGLLFVQHVVFHGFHCLLWIFRL